MQAIIDRLKEPSTYAGLAGIAIATGFLTPEEFDLWTGAVAGLFGFIAMFLPEHPE